MNLPFNTEQFLEVFNRYNNGVFPAQIIFYLLSFLALFLTVRNYRFSSLYINSFLAAAWLWMGAVYHIGYFASINKAANLFGIVFILQSIVFVYYGVIKNDMRYANRGGVQGAAAWIIAAYGLIIYPVLGYLSGHHYPFAPVLSAPCPTTIFTLGMLLLTEKRPSWVVYVIPLLWSVIAFMAALKLSITEDFGLLISGIITLSVLLYQGRTKAAHAVKA